MNGASPTVYVAGTGIIFPTSTSGTITIGGVSYPAITDNKGNTWGLWFNGGTAPTRWGGQGTLFGLSSNANTNVTSVSTANIGVGSMVGYGIASTSLSIAELFSVYTDSASTGITNIQAFFNNSANGLTSAGAAAGVSTGNEKVATAVFRPPTGTTKVLIGAVPQYSTDVGYGMFDISTTANTLIGKFMKPTLNVTGAGTLTNNPNNSNIIVGVWDYTTSNYAFAATENYVSTAGIAYVLII